MAVISTKKWIVEYDQARKVSKVNNINLLKHSVGDPLKKYFPGATCSEILDLLFRNGMFRPHPHNESSWLADFIKTNPWELVNKESEALRREWKGPSVPIFILPANRNDRSLQSDFNGKSGLSFRDKLFLFLSPSTEEIGVKAVLTHEYNHVCRLHYLNKKEEDLTLIDSIVLEGIAEVAVEKRLGKEALAKASSLYKEEQAKQFVRKWILPNKDMKKSEPHHEAFLYGLGRLPKWLGYNTGYHLVSNYSREKELNISELIRIPTLEIIEDSDFFTSDF